MLYATVAVKKTHFRGFQFGITVVLLVVVHNDDDDADVVSETAVRDAVRAGLRHRPTRPWPRAPRF